MFAYIFPGQGSQTVGMGKDLSKSSDIASRVFEEVDDALGMDLTKIMFEGPKEKLMLTENAQPAIMAVSVAVSMVIDHQFNIFSQEKSYFPKFLAGHSLGEYSALVSSGSLELSDAAKLLRIRGRAMQEAVSFGNGAMAAFLGTEQNQVIEIVNRASEDEICEIANDNGAGQVVISGNKSAVERAISIAKAYGVKKSMILPVSAPFHCKLMRKATEIMKIEIEKLSIKDPKNILISNVTGKKIENSSEIKDLLIKQIESRVRWRESVKYMIDNGVNNFIEIGPGKVLSGLIKRIDRNVKVSAINNEEDISVVKIND